MSFTWTEVREGIGSPGIPSLAGRTDDVVTSRGDAVAAVVSTASTALNSWAVDRAIERERTRLMRHMPAIFAGHERGGVLMVAGIVVRRVGELTGSEFQYMTIHAGIYASARDAISTWRHRDRLEAGHEPVSYRYFWVTRA